jgi:hypothetical protein
MRTTLLLVVLMFTGVVGYTKYLVPDWPVLGNPVHCLVQESYRNPDGGELARQCSQTYCTCLGGTQFVNQSLQCLDVPDPGAMCSTVIGCAPAYISCINDVFPGCSQAAVLQCEEHYMRKCNEGKACKWGSIPKGLTAGAILAIIAGIVYIIAGLLLFGLFMMARSMKAQAYEGAEMS